MAAAPDPLVERLELLFETKKALLSRLKKVGDNDPAKASLTQIIDLTDQRISEALEAVRRTVQAPLPVALPDVTSSGNNLDVTKAQKKLRGEKVAKGRAGNHPVSQAIIASKWKSQTAYAERLRISQPTLSQYIAGKNECPPWIADKVREDFGLGDGVWKKPPRR